MGSWFRRLFGSDDPAPSHAAGEREEPATSSLVAAPALDVDAAFWRWLLGVDDASPSTPHERERALIRSLRTAMANERLAERVPRVPAIVPQLLQMLRDPSRSASDVADLIVHDPVLVASVIRAANSPYYGAGRRIESLDHAVLILGHEGLRQLVAGVAMKPLINVQSGRFTRPAAPRVWEQSEIAGAACRKLAGAPGAGSFEAYLAILLRNVGAIVALRELDGRHDGGPNLGSRPFCVALGGAANELAAVIGWQWSFPEHVIAALAPDDASRTGSLVRASERVSRLRLLVDAGRVAVDDATATIANAAALVSCFNALGGNAAQTAR